MIHMNWYIHSNIIINTNTEIALLNIGHTIKVLHVNLPILSAIMSLPYLF